MREIFSDRRREIGELKVNTTNVNKQFNDTKNEIAELRKLVASIREELVCLISRCEKHSLIKIQSS